MLALLVLFLLNVVGVLSIFDMPDQGDPGGFAVPLAVFGVVMLVVILAAVMWPGAPRTPWFWLVGAIPGLLFFLPDIPIIIQAVTAPESVVDVVLAVAAAGSTIALLVSAAMSFRDGRRLKGPT